MPVISQDLLAASCPASWTGWAEAGSPGLSGPAKLQSPPFSPSLPPFFFATPFPDPRPQRGKAPWGSRDAESNSSASSPRGRSSRGPRGFHALSGGRGRLSPPAWGSGEALLLLLPPPPQGRRVMDVTQQDSAGAEQPGPAERRQLKGGGGTEAGSESGSSGPKSGAGAQSLLILPFETTDFAPQQQQQQSQVRPALPSCLRPRPRPFPGCSGCVLLLPPSRTTPRPASLRASPASPLPSSSPFPTVPPALSPLSLPGASVSCSPHPASFSPFPTSTSPASLFHSLVFLPLPPCPSPPVHSPSFSPTQPAWAGSHPAALPGSLSLSLLHALQPFKMLPLPCDSSDAAAAPLPPPRTSPSCSLFVSLSLSPWLALSPISD